MECGKLAKLPVTALHYVLALARCGEKANRS